MMLPDFLYGEGYLLAGLCTHQTSVPKHPFQNICFKTFLAVYCLEPQGYGAHQGIFLPKAVMDSAQLFPIAVQPKS